MRILGRCHLLFFDEGEKILRSFPSFVPFSIATGPFVPRSSRLCSLLGLRGSPPSPTLPLRSNASSIALPSSILTPPSPKRLNTSFPSSTDRKSVV